MTLSKSNGITVNIHGPIISSSDLSAHISLFTAFGLQEAGRCERTIDETSNIWSTDGKSSTEVTLRTPGTRFGVRLIQFQPCSHEQLRLPARGFDSEALKVIDFYTPDLDAARATIEAAGYVFKPEVAEYDTPEGRFRETHLWGPDGVVLALISGDPDYFSNFATVLDRLVSEPHSISGPVQNPAAALAFFADVFGLQPIHTYGLADESFDALVGTKESMNLRAWNVGTTTTEPYFGIIDYGLPAGTQTSLFDLALPPVRGLLGATVIVRDATLIAQRIGCSTVQTHIPLFGECLTATFRGPNGSWFQAIQCNTETS